MPMELVTQLPYNHPYRWDGSPFGGPVLWRPSALGTSLLMWLDVEDSSTIVLNGSTVSQWSDKSGNNNHATQATAASQPAYNATYSSPATPPKGTSVPAIVTSVANQNFVTPITLNTLSGYTMIAVMARTGNLSPGVASLLAGTSNVTSATPTKLQWRTGTNDAQFIHQATSALTSTATAAFSTNLFGIAGTSWNGSIANASMNGTLAANSASPFTSGFDNTPLYLFGVGTTSRGFIGATLEFVMTRTALATSERQQLEGYLAWKWGLQANLPVSHPYYNLPPTV